MKTEINPLPWQPTRDLPTIEQELAQVWPNFHHQVLEHIGGGGNGWIAKILMRQGKEAVVKYYATSLEQNLTQNHGVQLSEDQRKALIANEAKVMNQFEAHPAAVAVYDLAPNNLAFIMDYVSGGTLADQLTFDSWSIQEKIRLFLPVLDLLSALQKAGYHHRDLALDNILMTAQEQLKLIDFGYVHQRGNPVIEGWATKKGAYQHPMKDMLIQGDLLRHDIQDCYAAVICLLGWLHTHDPINGTPLKGWSLGIPDLDHIFHDYLAPSPTLPNLDTGIGSFDELKKNLNNWLISQKQPTTEPKKKKPYLKKWLGIAAMILISIFIGINLEPSMPIYKKATKEDNQQKVNSQKRHHAPAQDPRPTRVSVPIQAGGSVPEDLGSVPIQAGGFVPVQRITPKFRNHLGMELISVDSDLYLMKSEVTVKQWLHLMGTTPTGYENACADCPVVGITWYEVTDFINKLNKTIEKGHYRLPTVQEWDAFAQQSQAKRINWQYPVVLGEPDALGFVGLKDNAWEWCADWSHPEKRRYKAIRGGSSHSAASLASFNLNTATSPGARGKSLGFRLVYESS